MKGTNENLKNSKRIQLYKNKGDISNFNTTIRTNLNKFKIDLSKDLRYKFLNKYSAKDDFNFDIYIFPPPPGTIPSGYYQIPGDITKWRTAYQEKWVSSGGGPSDHGWYSSSYWEGNWTSYNTLYYIANFMEYSPTTGKFSNIRSYSVPIRYTATEYHGGTSGSGAYTTTYSGRYSNSGNRGNNYWPSNFSCTFTPPEYIEGWTLYEHSGNIYKYKKTEYGAEIKTTETNTSGKKNGVSRAPNIPDYVSKAADRTWAVRNLGNSYQIIYWIESRTKTITPQYNYRMSFDCTTGTFSNPVYDYIENVNYSSWYGSGIAYLGSSTNAWHADFVWSRN